MPREPGTPPFEPHGTSAERSQAIRDEDYGECVQSLVLLGVCAPVSVWAFVAGETLKGGAAFVLAALCAYHAWRTRPGATAPPNRNRKPAE